MALLRNLEQSLSGLLEGTVGRVFRTEVRPTEIARKLAREMEINKRVSLSRTYAPTDYLVYLSPDDRSRYAGVEHSIAEELGAYLLEHARRERLVLVRRPLVEFRTDERLRLGEFGIEARTAPISAEEAPARPAARVDEARSEPVPAAPVYDEPAAAPIYDDASEDQHEVLAEEPAYADPYAGDPFGGGDASQPDDFDWPRDQDDAEEGEFLEPEPAFEPALPAPEDEHEPDAEPDFAPAAAEADVDWLDPVDEWVPEQAVPAAEAPAPPRPTVPPVQPPQPAGVPWIDPTLSGQQARPPLAPPVVPPRRRELGLLIDGTPHELFGDRIVMGRSRSCDIVVSDPSISRQHLELRRDDRGWYAVDLGSTNGSQIDGTEVAEPRRLEAGMRLKLGHAPAIIEVR